MKNHNRLIGNSATRRAAADEKARERIRIWFEQHEHPLLISKTSRRNENWMLIMLLCASVLFGTQTAVKHAVWNIHSVFGV